MRRLGAGAWAALAAAPVALFVALHGLQDHYRFADESLGIFGGRQLQADFFGSFLDPQFSSRPLERVLALVWAGALEVTPTTAGAFQLAHVVVAILAASAAIPVALLLRGLGTRTVWAVVGGVIAITGPWAVLGVPLLNNAPGMTALAWTLLAAQRAVAKPGWRSDLLLCVAALVLGATRAGNAPLVAGVAPAILLGAWVRGGGVVGFARELVKRHWVLLGVAAAALGVLAIRGFAGLFGAYGAGRSTYLPWDLLLPGIRNFGGHLAVATGLIAFAFAVPWIVRAVVRPAQGGASPERVFALNAIGVTAAFLYVYAPALNEDRYFMAVTPLVVVPFVHAVTTRRLGLGWLAAGAGALAFFLVRGTDWPHSSDAYIQVPAAPWWNRVIEGRLGWLPGDNEVAAVVVVVLAALVAGLALARFAAGRAAVLVPAVVLGAVVVHQLLSGGYVIDRWIEERGNPDSSFAELTFADRATPGEEHAMLLRTNQGADPQLPLIWENVGFWNQEIRDTIEVGPQPPCCSGGAYELAWDDNGHITIGLTSRYVVTPNVAGAALVGETLDVSVSQAHRVIHVAEPARWAYRTVTQTPSRVSLHVWPRNLPGDGRPCLTGLLGDVTLADVDGERARIRREGDRGSIVLPDAQRLDVDLLHLPGRPPALLDLASC